MAELVLSEPEMRALRAIAPREAIETAEVLGAIPGLLDRIVSMEADATRYNQLLYAVLDVGFADKRTPEEAHDKTMSHLAWMRRTIEEQQAEILRLQRLRMICDRCGMAILGPRA